MTSTNPVNRAQAPYDPTSMGQLDPGALGKEDFLKLLVAQLTHQDPTKPTDPNEFVTQLSQFSSLEQLMNIRSGLDLVAITQTAGTSAQMVTFIGKEISYDGGQVSWSKGGDPVKLGFTLAQPAAEVEARIVDDAGNTIETRPLGALAAGQQSFVFDGKKLDGSPLVPGTYHVEISAKDAAGKLTSPSLRATGMVTAVTFEAGYPQLVLADGRTIGLGQVLEVLAPKSPETPDSDTPSLFDPTIIDDAGDIP